MDAKKVLEYRIDMRVASLFLLVVSLYCGCANHELVKGALSTDERRQYLDQSGTTIPEHLREPFIQGHVCIGMTKEMVKYLRGAPNRTENNKYAMTWSARNESDVALSNERDSIWNYFRADSVTVDQGLLFRKDTVALLLEDAHK